MYIKKFLTKNLSIFLGLSIAAVSLMGLYYLGKSYSDNSKYDFVLQINEKSTMNYSRATGDITRTTINFQDGLTVNSISDTSSNNLINDTTAWGDENLRQSFAAQTIDAQVHFTDDIDNVQKGDGAHGTNSSLEVEGQQWGIAEEGYVDLNYESYKFFIRENLYWSTGELLKPSDFAFALFKIMNKRNSSAAEYMPAKYAMLNGAKDWSDYQSSIILNDEEEDWSQYYKLFYDWDAQGAGETNIVTGQINQNITDAVIVFSNEENWVEYITIGNNAFLTILQNPMFMPINQEWFENIFSIRNSGQISKVGTDISYIQMGYDEDSLSTYGAFDVNLYDPTYGLELYKNDDYYNSDLITSNSMNLRVITEPSTQLAMFKSGMINGFNPDEVSDKTIFLNDAYSYEWIDWQLGAPSTRYINYNTDPDNTRTQAKFYKNTNFRKAIQYSFNRSHYIRFAGVNRGVPTSMITPGGLGEFAGNSIVDWAYDTELYSNDPNKSLWLNGYNESTREEILLTNQSDMDGVEYERGVEEVTNWSDPKTDISLAQYYWNEFLIDMNNAGINIPDTIELTYSTDQGDNDPIPNAIRESLNDANIPIQIFIRPIPEGSTISTWVTGDFDLISVAWNLDIGDPWGGLSVFNAVNREKTFNLTSAWNFWTGSKDTYGNTYTSIGADTSTFEEDGLMDMKDSGEIYNLIPDSITANGITLNNIHDFIANDIAWEDENPNVLLPVYRDSQREGDELTLGYDQINGLLQEDVFALSSDDKARLYITLEAVKENGAGNLQLRNALPNGVPYLSSFSSVPSLGYANQIYAYDPTKKEEIGMPNADAILKSRE